MRELRRVEGDNRLLRQKLGLAWPAVVSASVVETCEHLWTETAYETTAGRSVTRRCTRCGQQTTYTA
jgi:hypothetical protein